MNWLNNRERESKMKQYLTAGVALLLSCCVQSADTSAASGAAGADVPFITCFAADAEYTGTLLQSVKRGDKGSSDKRMAAGRQKVYSGILTDTVSYNICLYIICILRNLFCIKKN